MVSAMYILKESLLFDTINSSHPYFCDTIIISQKHLKPHICKGHGVCFTAFLSATHTNEQSVVNHWTCKKFRLYRTKGKKDWLSLLEGSHCRPALLKKRQNYNRKIFLCLSKDVRQLSWMSHGVMRFWFLFNFLFISAFLDILASLSTSRVFSSFSSGISDRWKSSCSDFPRTIIKFDCISHI